LPLFSAATGAVKRTASRHEAVAHLNLFPNVTPVVSASPSETINFS